MWDPWLHYFASMPFLSLGTFFYWKLQPFFHFSSLGPWPLTPFASLAAKVRYLNIWPCLFSPLCCIRLRRPKVELCCGTSRKTIVDRLTELRSEWTKPKTSVKQKSGLLGFFILASECPGYLKQVEMLLIQSILHFFIHAQFFPNKYILKYPLNGIPYLQIHVQLHSLN